MTNAFKFPGTCNLFNIFQTKLLFYLLSYLCRHKFLSSTMHKLYFVLCFQKINGALEATCHLLHGYHLCFMLLATSPLQFPSASATFSYPNSTRQGLRCHTTLFHAAIPARPIQWRHPPYIDKCCNNIFHSESLLEVNNIFHSKNFLEVCI
jgi:hypothetical protein